MLVSQRSVYMLQEKLRLLDEEEARELEQFSHPVIMNPFDEHYDYFACLRLDVSTEYNRRRRRVIWWSAHRNDVIAGLILLGVAGLGVYFVAG